MHAQSDTFEEHVKHLELLFKRALMHNITFNFGKSIFCHEHIEFLGYILTPDEIIPDPEKITSIKCFREPTNLRGLQLFLSFVNFYSRFVNNYAELTIPLLEFTGKDIKFKWQECHSLAFHKIICAFDNCMILAYVDKDKPFILTTDASNYAIAAILSQLNEKNEEQIVCFVSRTLKGSEINYFTAEKDLIAVVWALHKLESYLKGVKKGTVRMDHQAITFLNTSRFNNARMMRWSLSIQDFNIELEHIEGKRNSSAD